MARTVDETREELIARIEEIRAANDNLMERLRLVEGTRDRFHGAGKLMHWLFPSGIAAVALVVSIVAASQRSVQSSDGIDSTASSHIKLTGGAARAELLSDSAGARIDFFHGATRRMSVGVMADGSPSIAYWDASGTIRLEESLASSGTPRLVLRDKEGLVRLGIGVNGDGVSSLACYRGVREPRKEDASVALTSSAGGIAELSFRDRDGTARLVAGFRGDSPAADGFQYVPSIDLVDQLKRMRSRWQLMPDGTGRVDFFDTDGDSELILTKKQVVSVGDGGKLHSWPDGK